jgi:hypothetical protein
MVAALWNNHYRARIAPALGAEHSELADVAMADVNRMRNDVVHPWASRRSETRGAARCSGGSASASRST